MYIYLYTIVYAYIMKKSIKNVPKNLQNAYKRITM